VIPGAPDPEKEKLVMGQAHRILLLASIAGLLTSCYGGQKKCPEGFTACSGYCIETQGNFRHCGECDNTCASDKACVEGACIDFCGYAEVTGASEIAPYLRGEQWDAIAAKNAFVRVTGDVEIDAATLGSGYIFMEGAPGITLSSAIGFGFDSTANWNCDTYLAPQTGYGNALFSNATFNISMEHFQGKAADQLTMQEAIACGSSSSMGYCWVVENLIIPAAGECCCLGEPIDWSIVKFNPEPGTCTAVTSCDGPLTGSHSSECYFSYADYIAAFPRVAPQCVDEHGFVRKGHSCRCLVFDPDEGMERTGTCNGQGKCDLGYHCDYPTVCSTEADWCIL
jgi:hypothetical protein